MAMAVSNQQSRDGALLRATTEMFVLGTSHNADEIRRFEELARHYLARVSAADRAFVAELLSRSADAPGAVLRMLGKDFVEIASPILRRSPALGEFDLLAIIAATGPAHHRLIATRGDLSALVVTALRLAGDAEAIAHVATDTELAADGAPPEPPAPEITAASAEPVETPERPEPVTAEALEIYAAVRAIASAQGEDSVAADDEPAPSAAAAFLGLDRAARLAVLQQIGDNPAPPREGGAVIEADHAFRLALGRARLASLARQRQRDALMRTLAEGLRLPESDVAALLDDPSGEPLVILMRGIGLSDSEAQQVLLFANPVIAQGVDSFERLARLLAETKESVAADLIAGWREGGRPARAPAHQPLFADIELRRTMRPVAAKPASGSRQQEPPAQGTIGARGR